LSVLYVDGILDWLSGAAKSVWNTVKNVYSTAKPIIDVVLPIAQQAFPQYASIMDMGKNLADKHLAHTNNKEQVIAAGYTPS